ncbi:hypothetical protein SPHINGOAX6_30017 [Sphingomonas sp. AX6]|nr:hypothetical protein SPHINGOAX6_30017 [Sphingomonas sp. AX6]
MVLRGEATATRRGGHGDATLGWFVVSAGVVWRAIAQGRADEILHFQLNERRELGGKLPLPEK